MAIEILYIGNGCLGKHPFLSVCLGFQVSTQLKGVINSGRGRQDVLAKDLVALL